MTAAELAQGLARGLQVAATMSICGSMLFRCAIASSAALKSLPGDDRRLLQAFQRSNSRLIVASLIVAILSAGLWLPLQAAAVTDDGSIEQILAAIPIVAWGSHFGSLLLARLALSLLAVLVFWSGRSTWRCWCGLILASAAVVLQVGLGHGVSMAGGLGITLLAGEAVHLLAAAAWLGGLLPLYLLVRSWPVEAARRVVGRFSRLGLGYVLLLTVTIVIQSWVLVGSLAGLVGTEYGRLALVKGVLFALLVGLAALNRLRLMPAMTGAGAALATLRLRRSIAAEIAIGFIVILVAGILLTGEPAIHQQPDWPFAQRFSLVTLSDPDLRLEVLQGAGEACIALASLVLAIFWRRGRWAALAVAALLAWWSSPHLGLLLVPAYPTSFYQSPTGFTAASIVQGGKLFGGHCTSCHGPVGRGDGAQAKPLSVAPADLTAMHLFEHSDGEMFWWLSHGMAGPLGDLVMPGFADQLAEDERWNLIDYIRAHNAGLAMHDSGAWPHPIMAPDTTVTLDQILSPLSNHRGGILRVIAVDPGHAESPALPSVVPMHITTIVLRPGSDGWAAYAVVAGVAPDALGGTVFLVDGDGWLRNVLRPSTDGRWPDQSAFVAAAAEALAHPIVIEGGGHMHHH
jgi:putative copper export protein/mono/diheme cytochrome c family protein